MKLWQAVAERASGRRSISTLSDLARLLGTFSFTGLPQTIHGDREDPPIGFEQYAQSLFAGNPIVWTAELIRKAVFSQARFQYRNVETGRLFGDESLSLLEHPWPGGTTAKLLTRMLLHGDLGGNGYVLNYRPGALQMMRPDWVSIILGSRLEPDDPTIAEDAEVIGWAYMPRGRSDQMRIYRAQDNQVAHFAPMPDPLAHFRGMSWLTPVIREILGDKATVEHKLKFFEQGATPNIIIRFDATQTVEQVKAFKELIEEEHQGLADAYRTLYVGGGADATVVGNDLRELDFAKTQGKAETRILMAAGVHPVIAGASEGMQGASLNAGNFAQVRRVFSDIHLQDLWNEAAASLEVLVNPPLASELVVDDRRIPFLQDDKKDEAEIQRSQSRAIAALIREGFTAESIVAAITGNDMNLLQHTGRVSVQLQAPFDDDDDDDDDEEAA